MADVKPPAFTYVAARDVDHALAVLSQAGGEAKILAGGQSLMPMMNFRLLNPAIVLDINRIGGLAGVTERSDRLTLGALVRHRVTAGDPVVTARFPILAAVMSHVAHYTVRNRGTFVGSLCHADPAAEMPMMAVLLNAEIEIASSRGVRRVAARDFFLGPLTTVLAPDELVVSVDLPFLPADSGWGFAEFARRHGDYALAAVGVTLSKRDGRADGVRIAVMGVGDTPLRMPMAEAAMEGGGMDRLAAVIDAVRDAAIDAYRRHLVGVLAGRAVTAAWAMAR